MSANPQDIIQRKGKLASQRSLIERTWEACYDYSYPILGAGFSTGSSQATGDQNLSQGNTKKASLLTSVATDACRTLAAAMVSGITPSSSRWIEFGEERDEEEGDAVSRWLDQAADDLWKLIHASNYDAVAPEATLDTVIAGMAAMFIDEDPDNGGFIFEQWPLPGCYFAASKKAGPIDTVYRCFTMSAEQAMDEYEGRVSEATRQKAGKSTGKDDLVEFIHAIYPRQGGDGQLARNMPIASCHVEVEAKYLNRESGYHEMPVIVPRWRCIPGSAYAFSPMYEALCDAKQLNLQTFYVDSNMDLATAGMWGAVDDGVLNPKTVRIGPRKIVVMAAKDNMWPLQPATQFDSAQVRIDQLEASIRRILMADLLEPQDGPQKTAYEVSVHVDKIRQLLGPIYSRQISEWVRPTADRCFGLAYRAGALGQAPRNLLGRQFPTRSASPLARAQRLVDVQAMDRYETSLGAQMQIGMEDAPDVYDWDAARRERAKLLGVPAKLIRDSKDTEALRKAKGQQQSQQQIQAAALQKLLETPA